MDLKKIKNILNSELNSLEGLSFLEVLEMVDEKNSNSIEDKLQAIISRNQEKFDELINEVYGDKKINSLGNDLKLGLVVKFVIKMIGK